MSGPLSTNARVTPVSEGKANRASPPANEGTADQAAPGRHVLSVPESFSIDFAKMRQQGFYVPTEKAERLPLQLRAIKRRLLRRLKFQKVSNRRQTAAGDETGRPMNVVLTTSTRPAEGKTFTSINLAMSLAVEDNIGTILVDADALRPKVLNHFGLERGLGFTDLIDQPDLSIKQCLLREKTYPFAILPEGEFQGRTVDLFSREEVADRIREISMRFPDRIIIVDAPPVLAAPDAVLLAQHVDEVLFVVEANATPESAAATALDELLDVNEKVSLILNRALVVESAIHYGSYKEYYQDDNRR